MRGTGGASRPVGRVAVVYDVHGNVAALEAVLAEIEAEWVDHVVVGGDVIPGPMPVESIDALTALELPTTFISGNGERETLALLAGRELTGVPEAFHPVMRWVAEALRPDQVERLSSWAETARLDVAGIGEVLFCHATPRSDSEIFTRITPEAALDPIFASVGVPLVVCGHTHVPFDRTVGSVRVVNAGSVGMPFGPPGADWLLLGPDVEPRHTTYDLEGAADRVRSTEYPQAEEFATGSVLAPPSAEAMTELFEKSALG